MANLRSVTIRLDQDMYEKISRLPPREGESLSDTVRMLLQDGLREKTDAGSEQQLTEIVRREMVAVMEEYAQQLDRRSTGIAAAPAPLTPKRDYRISAFFPALPGREPHRTSVRSNIQYTRGGTPMPTINKAIYEIVEKALDGNKLSHEEIVALYSVETFSPESYYIQWAGRKMSMEVAGGKAEIHAQIGLDGNPCPKNCQFCSFAICNKVRKGKLETPLADVLEYAKIYEDQGANLILVLTTGGYKFDRLLETMYEIRNVISKEMPLLANTGDMTLEQAKALKAAGVNGIYHAVRMGEGTFTGIPVETRLETIKNARAAGLKFSTCVEPIGPEHSAEELAEKTEICLSMDALSAGAGRRVMVPGTLMEKYGMLSESRGALYVAAYRLADGYHSKLNCSGHSMLTANAGANLAWAEMGTNPRDLVKKTEDGGEGQSIKEAGKVFLNTEWEVRKGYSEGWM